MILNKRKLARLIYLTGTRNAPFYSYTVQTSGFDGCFPLAVPSVRIGNAIVRALRTEAAKRPDLFPPSKL